MKAVEVSGLRPSPSKPALRLFAYCSNSHPLRAAGYSIFAAVVFAVCFVASFPYSDTISAILGPTGLKLVSQDQRSNFPFGARLENVSLVSSDGHFLLRSPEVNLSPSLLWFLLGQPCLKISAQVYRGEIDSTIRQHSRSVILEFKFESLDLAQLIRTAGLPKPEGQALYDEQGAASEMGSAFSGRVSGRGGVELRRMDIFGSNGSIILSGHNVKAVLADGMPPVELGSVRGNLRLERGVATLENVRAVGADGTLEVDGIVQVAPDFTHSIVQLTLSLRPSARGRASFGPLLNMLPHAPADGPYHIQGALSSPSLT